MVRRVVGSLQWMLCGKTKEGIFERVMNDGMEVSGNATSGKKEDEGGKINGEDETIARVSEVSGMSNTESTASNEDGETDKTFTNSAESETNEETNKQKTNNRKSQRNKHRGKVSLLLLSLSFSFF
jgi:hypothetical protein